MLVMRTGGLGWGGLPWKGVLRGGMVVRCGGDGGGSKSASRGLWGLVVWCFSVVGSGIVWVVVLDWGMWVCGGGRVGGVGGF